MGPTEQHRHRRHSTVTNPRGGAGVSRPTFQQQHRLIAPDGHPTGRGGRRQAELDRGGVQWSVGGLTYFEPPDLGGQVHALDLEAWAAVELGQPPRRRFVQGGRRFDRDRRGGDSAVPPGVCPEL